MYRIIIEASSARGMTKLLRKMTNFNVDGLYNTVITIKEEESDTTEATDGGFDG